MNLTHSWIPLGITSLSCPHVDPPEQQPTALPNHPSETFGRNSCISMSWASFRSCYYSQHTILWRPNSQVVWLFPDFHHIVEITASKVDGSVWETWLCWRDTVIPGLMAGTAIHLPKVTGQSQQVQGRKVLISLYFTARCFCSFKCSIIYGGWRFIIISKCFRVYTLHS